MAQETESLTETDCLDCGIDTDDSNEYYMLKKSVWKETGLTLHEGILCIGCVEVRLGRQLTNKDFEDCALTHGFFKMSPRLINRINT